MTIDTNSDSTGLITKHIDTWDSLSDSDNNYFSRSGVIDLVKQLQPTLTPDLETPKVNVVVVLLLLLLSLSLSLSL